MPTYSNSNMKHLRPSYALLLLCMLCLLLSHITWRHLSISGQHRYTHAYITLPTLEAIKILQIADVQIGRLHLWLFEYMHAPCVFCYNGAGHGSYRPITKEQIDFFNHNSETNTLSLAFTHVPVEEYHQITHRLGSQHDTITAMTCPRSWIHGIMTLNWS